MCRGGDVYTNTKYKASDHTIGKGISKTMAGTSGDEIS